jgi:hypothetical protein
LFVVEMAMKIVVLGGLGPFIRQHRNKFDLLVILVDLVAEIRYAGSVNAHGPATGFLQVSLLGLASKFVRSCK